MEIIEVQLYQELRVPLAITAAPKVIDFYVDENTGHFHSGHLDEYEEPTQARAEGIKLLPHIEQHIVSGGGVGKSKITNFIDRITSYMAENYKSIIANLSLLIVFVIATHDYLISDNFNRLLNSALKLRSVLGGGV